jgi:hypothetical protein
MEICIQETDGGYETYLWRMKCILTFARAFRMDKGMVKHCIEGVHTHQHFGSLLDAFAILFS